MSRPKVELSQALTEQLNAVGSDPELMRETFADWKEDWDRYEFESYYFGKDGGYEAPCVDGHKYRLRHAHLPPVVDKSALARWIRWFRLRKRKLSDRALVYVVEPKAQRYLLILILDEPTAHTVAKMKDAKSRELMLQLARVAAEFVNHGRIAL